MRSEMIDKLSAWPYSTLGINRIKRYSGLCVSAIDQINLEVKLVLNGSLKLKLSEWWLDLIRSRVKQVLKELNYDFTAINFDYIDTPPGLFPPFPPFPPSFLFAFPSPLPSPSSGSFSMNPLKRE